MGRSHKKKGAKRKEEPVIDEEALDRFAGSSEEEDGNEEDERDETHVDADEELDSDHDESSHDNDQTETAENEQVEENDEFQVEDKSSGTAGMANAMLKILGAAKATTRKGKKARSSVILSKTKTPLQRLAEKERQQEKELREKRRLNREKSLASLHIPLSVATTSTVKTTSSKELVYELEQERAHRRVATRGVVALFNAIAQHQKKASEPTTAVTSTGGTANKKSDVAKLTKHDFLDMIKSTASSKANKKEEKQVASSKQSNSTPSKPQWNALRDDFMLNPKKNWDQEDDSSEDEGEEKAPDWSDNDDNGDNKARSSPAKRRRVGVK